MGTPPPHLHGGARGPRRRVRRGRVVYEEDRDEEERQREEAERALAGPVQVDVVRAARLRRLAGGGETS